ncbi:MAG: M20/M25/M40 family metallo-hydrolase [Cytophagaceae bacterium]|nr:MAG: M20/M25/M40 family metallo-hydrolase [Cytophagaceae bacterium]
MKPTVSRKFYAVPPLLWAGIMLVLTLTPAQEMPKTPDWQVVAFDTAAHAGVFAVLAVLSWVALRQQRRWPVLAQRAAWVVLVGCVLFGGLIEILQYLMHVGRQAEWSDLGGDSLGAALALLLVSGGWRWWQRRRLATPLLLLLLLLGSSLFFAPAARAQMPDTARARRTIEELAAPALHGRGYVQGGEHAAAAYLRGRLRQLGAGPLAPGYTQPFTLDVNTFPEKLELMIASAPGFKPAASQALVPGADFIAAATSGPADFRASIIPLDTVIFHDSDAAQQYLLPPPGSKVRACLTCPLLLRARDQARLASLPPTTQARIAARGQLLLVPKLTADIAPAQVPAARLEILAARWPAATRPQYATVRIDAELKHDYQTQNLAAIVRGKTQPDSFLVVTAHYDHLGMMGRTAYFPGANDNASGVALLLELAAHYARPENQPAYSVVFLLFGAEEAGLVGSRYFVAHPLVPLPRIKFLINLDLLGTGEDGATVVNGKTYAAAYQRLTALNDAHHYLPRLTARGRAANSDHFPFSEAGVPAFFIYTRGGSQAYHDVHDQPAALSLAGFSGAFGLVRDFLDGL